MLKTSMRVRFWGVRGSIACPGAETIRYGGNTPCIEVRCGERVLIFDAGTGLRPFGNALIKNKNIRDVDIFLTHCHLDHVVGMPFFAPFFAEGYKVRIWAGNLLPATSVEAACIATAGTAAPAPAAAPRTQTGGCPARKTADSPRMRISPGTMKQRPPRTAPAAPLNRQAQ